MFARFGNNESTLKEYIVKKHPLVEEIDEAVLANELEHSLKPCHLLFLMANTLEREYMPGVEHANVLARMAVVLYDNPRLLNELEAKMEELR